MGDFKRTILLIQKYWNESKIQSVKWNVEHNTSML